MGLYYTSISVDIHFLSPVTKMRLETIFSINNYACSGPIALNDYLQEASLMSMSYMLTNWSYCSLAISHRDDPQDFPKQTYLL